MVFLGLLKGSATLKSRSRRAMMQQKKTIFGISDVAHDVSDVADDVVGFFALYSKEAKKW